MTHNEPDNQSQMCSNERMALTHQALGEFVILFQWIENLYRQIGWLILDPERKHWPPMQLRTETNQQIIDKVTALFLDLTSRYSADKAKDMLELRAHFHALRKYRNSLLHSIYIEMEAGGEVHGYIRSNPEIGIDPDTGELIVDQENFSAASIHSKLREYGSYVFRLNLCHVQLIHWHPFAEYAREK